MPEMHQPEPAAAGVPPMLMAPAGSQDDLDYALGCECAYPQLQIERWGLEAGAPVAELS